MKILLMCGAGMSTSLLVKKMEKQAKDMGYNDISIDAVPIDELENYVDLYDVFLLGPQVRYMEKKAKDIIESKGKKCTTIPPQVYGRVDGKKTLEIALDLAKKGEI
ncbi:PTS sugar transporter subunit IIB [Thermoanaerobacterium butyriciformans]|uniref:PTS system cellobiose-specific IIB component n=1 Tax=Thermoanaerobacterium butyriciformans TaxID=1702242 RepID=A0ABS4ND05_9THEO|nr:PTS sugar transporter subunit IIB [Thermoanaerobacterium butyriciformans]MBP2071556.1 PTS system cellobiose-specific IIB component [Thermoanaerobacterium butyriciformans]